MKKTILLLLLLPLATLSAKETTRVVMRMQIKCTISKPGIFADYAERYLGVKNAVKTDGTDYLLTDIQLFEKGKEPVKEEEKIDTVIRLDMNCLNEEALQATSIPKMAERAAKQIYQLREARTAIITGDMNVLPDGEAIKAMLKRIDQEEQKLIALFVGKRVSYTYYKDVTFTPGDKDLYNDVLVRFSRLAGVVDSDDMIGEPIYLSLAGKRIRTPELTEKQKKKVYEYIHMKGNAWIRINYGEKIERELYLDEVIQYGADIPLM